MVWDIGDVHGQGSARAERVRPDIFWGKPESGYFHSQSISADEGDDVGCADGAEAMIRGKLLMGVVGLHPRMRRRRKILMPVLTGKSAADSDRKWERVSPRMVFF